jgi:hypothetical protein
MYSRLITNKSRNYHLAKGFEGSNISFTYDCQHQGYRNH